MKKLLPIAVLLTISGCARFHTVQYDESYNATNGVPIRKITTKVTASAFFEANSELTKFKASQTDKTQSAAVGSLNQTATSTNIAAIAGAVTEAAVKASMGK